MHAERFCAGRHAVGMWQVLATMSTQDMPVDLRERLKTALDSFVAHDMFTE